MTIDANHVLYLDLALAKAASRRGFCAPNPAVGAVIVKQNQIIATGRHWAFGAAHAEVDALQKAGEQARGATLYVTLEPCCHQGKTPPCTDAIIQSGIAKVYYGMADLNPAVAGKSAAVFAAAGISSEQIDFPEIQSFYQSYTHWWQTARPWVTAKLALSWDGKIAGKDGQPMQITGGACQRFTHQHRRRSDAILTTAETILHDNPQLNVRLDNEIIAKSIYILDSHLRINLQSRILKTAKQITVFHAEHISKEKIAPFLEKQIRCIPIDISANGLDLDAIVTAIGAHGVHDLWVEAGGRCFQSFYSQKLLNRAFIYISSKQLGKEAKSAFTQPQPLNIIQQNAKIAWQTLGTDLVGEFEL